MSGVSFRQHSLPSLDGYEYSTKITQSRYTPSTKLNIRQYSHRHLQHLPTMPSKASPRTLFHLIPLDEVAAEALTHPDNRRFVSPGGLEHEDGLEFGFHVPSIPRSHVITRLGRDADLILPSLHKRMRAARMAKIHVQVEMDPSHHMVVLKIRDGNELLVFVEKNKSSRGRNVSQGNRAIVWGESCIIDISSYRFELVRRHDM